eukprot:UN02306
MNSQKFNSHQCKKLSKRAWADCVKTSMNSQKNTYDSFSEMNLCKQQRELILLHTFVGILLWKQAKLSSSCVEFHLLTW